MLELFLVGFWAKQYPPLAPMWTCHELILSLIRVTLLTCCNCVILLSLTCGLGEVNEWLRTASHCSYRLSCGFPVRVLKPPNMGSWKPVAYGGITAFSAPLFAQTVVSLDLDCFKGSRHYLRCTNEGAIKKQRPIESAGQKNTLVSRSLIWGDALSSLVPEPLPISMSGYWRNFQQEYPKHVNL